MNRHWIIGGGLLVGATSLALVAVQLDKGRAFIAGDQRVNSEQVRQRLQSDGWSDIQINRKGRYIEAIASKNGQVGKVAVDSRTGRLRAAEDDDDDNDDDDDD
jgi:hypothetical protein